MAISTAHQAAANTGIKAAKATLVRAYHLAGTPALADLVDHHQEVDMEAHHNNRKAVGDLLKEEEEDHLRLDGDHLKEVHLKAVEGHKAGDRQVAATTRVVHLTTAEAPCQLDGHLNRHGKALGHRHHRGHHHRTQAVGVHLPI